MRRGSITFGSLGWIPGSGLMAAGFVVLMVPICAAALGGFTPLPAAAEEVTSESVQQALVKRRTWLDEARARIARKQAPKKPVAAKKVKPLKIITTRASWYGPGFHGRRTASGERFNQHGLTLASRHLPFGTRVRVINLKNGKSAIGRVNDRGPFCKGRGADLSRGLAQKIGILGVGKVRLEILPRGAR